MNLLFSSPCYRSLSASLAGEILHASQTAGKGRKGKQTAGEFHGIPNPPRYEAGGLKGHLRFGKAAGQIREPLAQWCLTPDDRCTFAWENPTGEDVTTG